MKQLVVLCALALACTGQIGEPGSDPATPPATAPPGAGPPPGGAPPLPPGSPACTTASVGAGKWRRLTALQYRNTVKDLLGLDADTSAFLLDTTSGPFATNSLLPPESADIDHYAAAAEDLAVRAVTNLPRLLGCDPAGQDACATRFIGDFGGRAYRRPLAADEKTALAAVYTVGKEESFTAGIRLVVQAVLQSPSFLYLTELGAGTGALRKLTGHEVASRLSYLFWNSMPDAELTMAAGSGALDAAEGIRAQTSRLLASPRFTETVTNFHSQLFGILRLGQDGVVSKDATKYPQFNAALRAAMIDETTRFLSYVFSKGDSTIATLLSAPYSFPAGELAKLYRAPAAGADGRVDFADGTRFGILTQGSWLASEPPIETRYQAVQRGKSVRFNLLCQTISPPPVAVDFTLPPGADKMTQQQLLRAHQVNPSCRPCHELMDNIGFGFENYDAIGAYRSKAADGSPVDASGDVLASDVAGPFTGVKELTERLARSKDVRSCLARQWFRFTFGRDPADADRCSLGAVDEAFQAGGGDVRRALAALASSDAFRFRRGE